MLRQRSADAHALIPEFESIREASMARVEAENVLKRLTSHPQDGGFNLKPDDRRVTEQQRLLDKVTADFKRLQELQTVRTAAMACGERCAGERRDMVEKRQARRHGAGGLRGRDAEAGQGRGRFARCH